MANPQVYSFPTAAATAICTAQTLAGAGSLVLDGTISKTMQPQPPVTQVFLYGINRVITLTTSGHDDSAANITVTGTLQGAVVSQTISGPNNTTVATTQTFDSITSVTSDAAITAMSVGTGTTGYTDWFYFDRHGAVANLAIAAIATSTINYDWQVTLDDPNTVASPNVFTPITALTGATTSILGNYTAPFVACRVKINSSSGSGALTTTILQQGLHS